MPAQHTIECGYHVDQFPSDCNCGLFARRTAAIAAEELSGYLRDRNIDRATACMFLNRLIILEALEAFAATEATKTNP